MLKLTPTLIRTTALAAVLGSFAFTVPAFATETDTSEVSPAVMDQAPANQDAMAPKVKTQTRAVAVNHMQTGPMNVEARIKTLHDKLMITPPEENDWSQVAQTMRDNESNIHQLIKARHENPENMTAVEDLQSYQQITQAHADGLQKLTTSFQNLYNDMSDAQKKNADVVFGRFEGHRDGMMKKKS